MDRPDWDVWALSIAGAVATRADCRRRKVGAVILDSEHRVVSTGYNGAPPGRGSCLTGDCPRGLHTFVQIPAGSPYDIAGAPSFCIAVHAEANAILSAERHRLIGSTLYVTDGPCKWCDKIIAATRISKLIYPNDDGTLHVRLL